MPEQLFIGLMSGTSVDGIDAALVAIESKNTLRVLETEFTTFEPELRAQINDTAQNNARLQRNEDSPLHQQLAPLYAQACRNLATKANIDLASIDGIANHGQTVKHEPQASPPYSLQLGDGQLIANLTGVDTYTQFRQADLNAGGQGAPLMPAFHAAIFGDKKVRDRKNSFILNIGGIANLTRLGSTVIGFDTGPGNVLLDQWIEKHQGKRFDKDGAWATSGTINHELLTTLMADDYFQQAHPKSTGTDYFNLAWLESSSLTLNELLPEDVQATLLALTVHTIAGALQKLGGAQTDVYVCGGGAHNSALMTGLRSLASDAKIEKTDALGVPSDWVEAVGFAWLGYCCKNGLSSNLPSVTGADKLLVLGEHLSPETPTS